MLNVNEVSLHLRTCCSAFRTSDNVNPNWFKSSLVLVVTYTVISFGPYCLRGESRLFQMVSGFLLRVCYGPVSSVLSCYLQVLSGFLSVQISVAHYTGRVIKLAMQCCAKKSGGENNTILSPLRCVVKLYLYCAIVVFY